MPRLPRCALPLPSELPAASLVGCTLFAQAGAVSSTRRWGEQQPLPRPAFADLSPVHGSYPCAPAEVDQSEQHTDQEEQPKEWVPPPPVQVGHDVEIHSVDPCQKLGLRVPGAGWSSGRSTSGCSDANYPRSTSLIMRHSCSTPSLSAKPHSLAKICAKAARTQRAQPRPAQRAL